MQNGQLVTIPAAARAMNVTRIVLERAIRAKALVVIPLYTGSKGAGFRLIPVENLKVWLKSRGGYHESLRGGATKFHAWGARTNPETVVAKALAITNGK